MQERRYRPGDVLDDYCPRERRITDHAIVAMIDDEIRRTRCGICDAEHEYKEAKVPPPRRKTPPPALFNQVLEDLNGSAPRPQPVMPAEPSVIEDMPETEPVAAAAPAAPAPVEEMAKEPPEVAATAEVPEDVPPADDAGHEGGFRRSLIRATFPRPEGQAPPPRALPEFTVQSLNNRGRNNGQRHAGGANKFRGGRRRPAGGGSQDHLGPMRFRDHGHGDGRPQGQGQGGGRRRRGGKKNR
jgi:hypothetical protein